MTTMIPLVGLAANDPVPGNYIAVNFAQGQSAGGSTTYSAVLLGNKLSTGSATNDSVVYGPDTPVQLATETDAVNLFGVGSELHLMWKAFTDVNKSTALYAVCVTESAGSQATGRVAVTGLATAPGTLRVTVGTTFVDTGIATGDGYAAIATLVAANINAVVNLPVTASTGTDGVVLLTAKQKGLRGNWIRHSAVVIPSAGVGIVVTPAARTLFTGGTTADSNAAALATISTDRYYYQVSAAEDASQFGALVSQTDSNAAPIVGLRCRAFAGSVDTVGATTTIATGINSARAEIFWSQNSDLTPAQLAANSAAIYSLFETSLGARSSLNYDFFGNDAVTSQYWKVPAPIAGTIPSRNTIKSALLNGITPVGVSKGRTYLVKRVTTRSLQGSTADYRIRDAHKVTVCDQFSDDLLSLISSAFSGKQIGSDPLPGQKVSGAQVVTPSAFKVLIFQLLNSYAEADLVQNVADIKTAVQVVREVTPATRLSARIPLQPVDILDSTATNVDQL